MRTYVDEYYMALTEQEKDSFRNVYGLNFHAMNGNIMVALSLGGKLLDGGLMSFSNFMLSIQTRSIIFNPCRVVSEPGRVTVFRDCDNDTLVFDYQAMKYSPAYGYQFQDDSFDFLPDLLMPAAVFDSNTGSVLMVGATSDEAIRLTRESGRATFYSRTRQKIWVKGETSGNYIPVDKIRYNTRGDGAVVYETSTPPPCVCHTGKGSCFTYDWELTRMFG